MKSVARTVICVLVLAAVGATAWGTGGTEDKAQASTSARMVSNVDVSRPVKLKAIMAYWEGPYSDWTMVLEAANQITAKTINTTIEPDYMPYDQYNKQVPLLIAAGEKFDLLGYSSSFSEASKGGLYDLTEILPKVFPESLAGLSKLEKLSSMYEGKIYAIPRMNASDWVGGFAYREDLRKKYNIPPIESLVDLERYMEQMKRNVPDVIPFHLWNVPYLYMLHTMCAGWSDQAAGGNSYFLARIDTPNAEYAPKIQLCYEVPVFREALLKIKDWNDRGFFPKNAYQDNTGNQSTIQYQAGNGWVTTYALSGMNGLVVQNPDWEHGFWYYHDSQGNPCSIFRKGTKGPGTLVPRTSENPERAVLWAREVNLNLELQTLLKYGMVGQHYNLQQGRYVPTKKGETDYPPEKQPLTWALHDPDKTTLLPVNAWPRYEQLVEETKRLLVIYPLWRFGFNWDPVKAETTACTEVWKKYSPLIYTGTFDDVDKFIRDLKTELEAAGVKKVQAEAQKQASESPAFK